MATEQGSSQPFVFNFYLEVFNLKTMFKANTSWTLLEQFMGPIE